MNMKIQLLEDIKGAYDVVYRKNEIFEIDEPYQGINKDGTFTICGGMSIYITVPKDKFKIINEERKKEEKVKIPFFISSFKR